MSKDKTKGRVADPQLRQRDVDGGTGMSAKLDKIAKRIRFLQKKTARDVIEMGRELIEARKLLKHSEWGLWLESELGWDYQTAIRCTRVAELAEKVEFNKLLNLVPSVLYLISAPTVTDDILDEVFERADKGERMTVQKTRALLVKPARNAADQIPLTSGGKQAPVSELTVEKSVNGFARCLRKNFHPSEIYLIFSKAVQPKHNRNLPPLANAVRWVQTTWEMFGPATEYSDWIAFCVADGHIYASNIDFTPSFGISPHSTIVAGAPVNCPGRFTILPGRNFHGLLERFCDPTLKVEGDYLLVKAGDAQNTVMKFPTYCPKKIPEYLEDVSPPKGQPYPITRQIAFYLEYLGGLYRAIRLSGSFLCFEHEEIYFNWQRQVSAIPENGLPWPEEFAVPAEVAAFMKNKRELPVQLMVEDDWVYFIWENGYFLRAARSPIPSPCEPDDANAQHDDETGEPGDGEAPDVKNTSSEREPNNGDGAEVPKIEKRPRRRSLEKRPAPRKRSKVSVDG